MLRYHFQNGSRKIICDFARSVVSVLLKYCLNFIETWRYINILIPIISILDCISTQQFPQNSFLHLKEASTKLLLKPKQTVGLKSQNFRRASTTWLLTLWTQVWFCNKELSFKWNPLSKQIEKNGGYESKSAQNLFVTGG